MKHVWSRRNFLGLAGLAGLPPGAAGQTPSANDFHFAIVGDRTGSAHPQIYTRVIREISLFDPDFAVSVGDPIEGLKDATAAAEWDAIDAVYKRYKRFPLYFTPGNHDIWNAASEKLYTARTGRPPHYSFTHQNALFVILDNSRTEELTPEQLDFAEAELSKHASRQPKFLFFHRPFWLIPIRLGTSDLRLHKIATKFAVNYVVSGHGHQLVHLQREGVHYLEVGSSGGNIARGWVKQRARLPRRLVLSLGLGASSWNQRVDDGERDRPCLGARQDVPSGRLGSYGAEVRSIGSRA